MPGVSHECPSHYGHIPRMNDEVVTKRHPINQKMNVNRKIESPSVFISIPKGEQGKISGGRGSDRGKRILPNSRLPVNRLAMF